MSRAPKSCRHKHHSLVGVDSTAHFYRCDDCGEVVVAQGGQLWTIVSRAVTA